ncbi:MAG: putative oxidoreductase C-terminal domain-containing protein [Chitinophagaceae bacterium]
MQDRTEFRQVTKEDTYPGFLEKDVKDNLLNVCANGEMHYTIKGIHAIVSVNWKIQSD